MRQVTFDIETTNIIPALDRNNLNRLEISIVGVHDSETNEYTSYTQEEFPKDVADI